MMTPVPPKSRVKRGFAISGSILLFEPMSEATTRGIRVEVEAAYVPERSAPERSQYFFSYDVRVSNVGDGGRAAGEPALGDHRRRGQGPGGRGPGRRGRAAAARARGRPSSTRASARCPRRTARCTASTGWSARAGTPSTRPSRPSPWPCRTPSTRTRRRSPSARSGPGRARAGRRRRRPSIPPRSRRRARAGRAPAPPAETRVGVGRPAHLEHEVARGRTIGALGSGDA